jgi:citrate lyase subunit beta/citryl-CoA lyase
MLAKATRSVAHAFVPDLEDSVPPAEKEAARGTVADSIPALSATGRTVIPRVNSLESGLFELDVDAVAGTQIAGISVGKIRGADDIRRVDSRLASIEGQRGVPTGTIGILPWIETAAALTRAAEICAASRRVRWVAFGAEDLTADMGVPRASDRGGASGEPSGEQLLVHARAMVAIAARASGAWALDTPYVHFKDEPGLIREAALARQLGFKGKFAIHPAQVEPINRAFSPSEAEVSRARMVIAAWEAAAKEGRGAISIDGEMIDVPVVARARALLREAGDLGGR